MNIHSCTREPEVRELLQQGHWPGACEPELRAHIDTCTTCAEAVQFAQIFQAARAASMQSAPMAAAGPIWWRAQLRRRNAALERIAKPIRTAQIFAAAVCLVTTLAIVIFEQRSGSGSLLSDLLHPTQLWPSSGWSLTLLISSFATITVLAAVALFLATEANETTRQ
jgi:hypothetical protein